MTIDKAIVEALACYEAFRRYGISSDNIHIGFDEKKQVVYIAIIHNRVGLIPIKFVAIINEVDEVLDSVAVGKRWAIASERWAKMSNEERELVRTSSAVRKHLAEVTLTLQEYGISIPN